MHSSPWFIWFRVDSVDSTAPSLFKIGRHRGAKPDPLATARANLACRSLETNTNPRDIRNGKVFVVKS